MTNEFETAAQQAKRTPCCGARTDLPYRVVGCPKCNPEFWNAKETLAQEHMRRVHGDGSECEDGCDQPVLP